MTMLGGGALNGQAGSPATRAAFDRLARLDPLNPQPFLFAGAVALSHGDQARAARMFAAAERSDPRSPAARYFMAMSMLDAGRIDRALDELATLQRLVPGIGDYDAAFARYARESGNLPAIATFLERNPAHRAPMLLALSADPANAALVLRLAGPVPDAAPPSPDWRPVLLDGLIGQGRLAAARDAWQHMVGRPTGDGLFNPGFLPSTAPAPFNWTFRSDESGLIEPNGAGQLNIVYYGRRDVRLAEQTVLLPPGRYRLAMSVAATSAHTALQWAVTCRPGDRLIALLSLDRAGAGIVAGQFDVPADCRAQRIALRGSAGLIDQPSEVTLSNLSLARVTS